MPVQPKAGRMTTAEPGRAAGRKTGQADMLDLRCMGRGMQSKRRTGGKTEWKACLFLRLGHRSVAIMNMNPSMDSKR